MKIAAISYRVPSLIMSNSDMIEMVDRLNPETSRLRKAIFFRTIDTLYGRLGAKTRHVRDVARGEKAVDVILGAIDGALASADMAPEDIDLLIYCGVGRGFLEPANSYFYARARGMRTTNCFDVTDACTVSKPHDYLAPGDARTETQTATRFGISVWSPSSQLPVPFPWQGLWLLPGPSAPPCSNARNRRWRDERSALRLLAAIRIQ